MLALEGQTTTTIVAANRSFGILQRFPCFNNRWQTNMGRQDGKLVLMSCQWFCLRESFCRDQNDVFLPYESAHRGVSQLFTFMND